MTSFYYNYQNALRIPFSFKFYSLSRMVKQLPPIIWEKKIGKAFR